MLATYGIPTLPSSSKDNLFHDLDAFSLASNHLYLLFFCDRIKQEDFLTGLPMNRESWSMCYGGVRATHGFLTGKLYFEASDRFQDCV
jgi:hypothetical protein